MSSANSRVMSGGGAKGLNLELCYNLPKLQIKGSIEDNLKIFFLISQHKHML